MKKFEGQVIKISPSSTQYINPMDINANYSEEDNPIALKADFILSLCELIVGGKEGLQPVEKTVIDRCVHQIYQTYFENPVPENMPVLQDLYEALLRQDEKEAHHVATALEILSLIHIYFLYLQPESIFTRCRFNLLGISADIPPSGNSGMCSTTSKIPFASGASVGGVY